MGQQAHNMLQKTVRKKILPTPEQSDELKSSLLLAKFWMLSIWKIGYLKTNHRSWDPKVLLMIFLSTLRLEK